MQKSLLKNIESLSPAERKEIVSKLKSIIYEIERYRGAYFWTPGFCAAVRRSREFENEVEVVIGTDVITFTSSYRESCNNCYYTKDLRYNGNSTNTTLLKNIVAKLEKLEAAA